MAVNLKFLSQDATSVNDTAITELNFGNIIRGNSKQVGFKVGNTGNSIAESVTAKIEGSSAAVAWKTISIDGGFSWATEVNLPNIAASNGLTDVIKVKSTVPSNAQTGSYVSTMRIEYIYL